MTRVDQDNLLVTERIPENAECNISTLFDSSHGDGVVGGRDGVPPPLPPLHVPVLFTSAQYLPGLYLPHPLSL